MRTQRLGCLTPIGLLAALITLLMIAGVSAVQGGRMFSPGGLSAASGPVLGGVASHEALGGRCAACHAPLWSAGGMTARCLECHTRVQADLTDPTTLHGSLVDRPEQVNCRTCHTEHDGPQAELTRMDLDNFPHEATGFSLLAHGKHPDGKPFMCSDCHTHDLTRLDPLVCADCHNLLDPSYMRGHVTAFDLECLNCHDGVDVYSEFDHDQTQFPLLGLHQEADCQGCHEGSTTLKQLQSNTTGCADCHSKDDAHAGQLGSDCADCHTPDGWTPAAFDHDLSGFPLTGAHQSVGCTGCHLGGVFHGTPAACIDCHSQDDLHAGQFGTDCAACHATDRWDNVTFDHALTSFPLTGAHTVLDCQECHAKGYQGTPTQCGACHAEPAFHAGLFAADCAACHDVSSWLPAGYEGPHTFPRGHGDANTCRDCHPSSLGNWTCYTCHDQEEIVEEHTEEDIFNFSDCLRCHPDGEEHD